jgi:hypothetical protein
MGNALEEWWFVSKESVGINKGTYTIKPMWFLCKLFIKHNETTRVKIIEKIIFSIKISDNSTHSFNGVFATTDFQ